MYFCLSAQKTENSILHRFDICISTRSFLFPHQLHHERTIKQLYTNRPLASRRRCKLHDSSSRNARPSSPSDHIRTRTNTLNQFNHNCNSNLFQSIEMNLAINSIIAEDGGFVYITLFLTLTIVVNYVSLSALCTNRHEIKASVGYIGFVQRYRSW